MKNFSHSQRIPASAQYILDAVTSEDYLHFRYADPDLADFALEILEDGAERFRCRVERVVDPGERIPRAARRLVGDRLRVVQENEWLRTEPPYVGSMRVTVPGMPGEISGDLHIHPLDDDNARIDAEGHVRVNLPLVGSQLENLLIGTAERNFAESMDAIRRYVASD